MSNIRIVKNEEASRYEAWEGEALAGFAEYGIDGDVAEFPHTEVASEHGGKGVGSAIVAYAMSDIGGRYSVRPTCPFVKAWIDKHPEAKIHTI